MQLKKIFLSGTKLSILKSFTFSLLLGLFLSCTRTSTENMDQAPSTARPNVILILTDDQGFGDLGFHGNPDIITPVLDSFAAENIPFSNFYVSPVCSPTRASLLTGRYNIRTGVFDTFSGGSMMATEETTCAEIFRDAGYATGHFGKWHLGDNYPFRPQDQGFETSAWNPGGRIGGPGDVLNFHKKDTAYFDPILWKNGKIFQSQGYCSDVFTEEAMAFMNQNKKDPFFVYLAFNAPHKPLQLPEAYYNLYKDKEIDPEYFRSKGQYIHDMSEKDKEDARKVYGMVTNIDDNLGRLFSFLKKSNLEENTIVIFMTDNGPAQYRYTGGFRGKKSLVSEGGIRVPFYLKLPKSFNAPKEVKEACAHIDLLPTLAELCGIDLPKELKIDGQSLVPLLSQNPNPLKDRPLFFEWQRSYPEKYKNMAVLKGGYKLIGNTGEYASISEFELFNLTEDPYESENIVEKNPAIAQMLKKDLDSWYDDMMTSPNLLDPPRIIIGNEQQNRILLDRNDAQAIPEIRAQEAIPIRWNVLVEKPGDYIVSCIFMDEVKAPGKLYFRIGNKNVSFQNEKEDIRKLVFEKVTLKAGKYSVDSWYSIDTNHFLTPFCIEIEKI